MARLTTLQALRAHPRVEIVDDERSIGNGVIVTLKAGWTFDLASDNRVQGADSHSAALQMVRRDAKRTVVELTV